MRYKEIYITACRAFSKSYISILGMILQCIFIPGTRRFIAAPQKKQGASIAKEKILEIYERFPLIRKEVVGGKFSNSPGNFGSDYVVLTFLNGSTFEVVGALESTRGKRKYGGLIDEVRDQDEQLISEVVLPLLNVSRRLPDGTVNKKEPNQQAIYMTSAGSKASFAYNKLISVFENSIIDPQSAFCFGCDYRVPMMHGLISREYVNNLKTDPSYNSESFGREYLSIWGGSSSESYYSYDRIVKYRKLKNPEMCAKYIGQKNVFYIISVDVGRIHDQTVASVFRVNIDLAQSKYRISLVNMYVLGRDIVSKSFTRQALDIKKIIKAFQPKEVVIDTNGLGIGLAEEMVKEQTDVDGQVYPAYGFFNDEVMQKIQPKDAPKILYGIKANATLKMDINVNVYTRLMSGNVRFLVKEQEAKSALLATKVGQKMSLEERTKRLMPHEMTTAFFNEMCNLRIKKGSDTSKIVLEQINSRYPDDKYYSFAYGLWRIKELEESAFLQRRKQNIGKRQLIFFTGG